MDMLGSYDADDQCSLNVLHFGVGDISENDITLAETFSGDLLIDYLLQFCLYMYNCVLNNTSVFQMWIKLNIFLVYNYILLQFFIVIES